MPSVTGLWSLDPNTGDLFLLEHSPSGSFRPFVDSFGRVLFTRWDHLARDVEAVTDRNGTSANNVFNWSDESAAALVTTNTIEFFPEPRSVEAGIQVFLWEKAVGYSDRITKLFNHVNAAPSWFQVAGKQRYATNVLGR